MLYNKLIAVVQTENKRLFVIIIIYSIIFQELFEASFSVGKWGKRHDLAWFLIRIMKTSKLRDYNGVAVSNMKCVSSIQV